MTFQNFEIKQDICLVCHLQGAMFNWENEIERQNDNSKRYKSDSPIGAPTW